VAATSLTKICRFKDKDGKIKVGCATSSLELLDLTPAGVTRLEPLLETDDPAAQLRELAPLGRPIPNLAEIQWCAPVEHQEVWAAGVTYLRSKDARMEESDFSATAYDKVYAAERPEIFFKALAQKVAASGEFVGIRHDSRWNVPEPELALVLNSSGKIVGYTIGNDMSSRDIEGENLLYLPQAKIYHRSCALGPWITLGVIEQEARQWKIRIEIRRAGENVFRGETSVDNIKRRFNELAGFLCRSQKFPHGVVLLTGTGIVPPAAFTLEAGDVVRIEITGIGLLQNTVTVV
jgi:2-dehydro-3-deoxy-D-arabinonate dehydratase